MGGLWEPYGEANKFALWGTLWGVLWEHLMGGLKIEVDQKLKMTCSTQSLMEALWEALCGFMGGSNR